MIFRRMTYIILGMVLLFFAIALYKKKNAWIKTGLALLCGGALSNEADRFAKGSVTDYFSLRIHRIDNIVFNLGDVAIFTGAILICIGNNRKKQLVITEKNKRLE